MELANLNSNISWRVGILKNVAGFLEKYRDRTLGEVFADNRWVSIYDKSLKWLDLPSDDFLLYAENKPRFAFDGVPDDPNIYRNNPTFLILQAHRVWATIQMIDRHLSRSAESVMLDLGAYPFTLDLAVRNYLHRDCRIVSTINQVMQPEWEEPLRQKAGSAEGRMRAVNQRRPFPSNIGLCTVVWLLQIGVFPQ